MHFMRPVTSGCRRMTDYDDYDKFGGIF